MQKKAILHFMILFSILIFILFSNYSISIAKPQGYIEVSGNAFLADTTDHSGISVLFQAISPSAVTDSAFTGSDGSFSRLLQVGIYDVFYSKNSYFPYQIPGGQFFTNDTTLDDVLMEPGITDTISGNVSGRLYQNTVYFVDGDISVQNGDTLIIESGASIRFLGYHQFNIYGLLLAQGAEGDSITFTSGKSIPVVQDWQGIEFKGGFDTNSVFSYCRVQFAHTGINWGNQITDCIIQNNYCGITNSPIVIRCIIQNNSYRGVVCFSFSHLSECIIQSHSSHAIECWGNAIISQCTIQNNNSTGVWIESGTPSLSQCTLRNNGFGIYCYGGNLTIGKCAIYANSVGIEAYGCGDLEIKRCSIYDNNTGIDFGFDLCSSSMTTSILNGNNTAIISDIADLNVVYCGFFDNNTNFMGGGYYPEIGKVVTTNANGDSCDTYFNIFLDPRQVDPENGNFNLLSDSPCIDAGDTSLAYDPDSTIADIGAYYYHQGSPPPAPVAEFTASPLIGTVPHPVTFTNLSSGAITSYLWHFGDGRTSILREPAHYYTEPDTYSVSLTVTGPGGTDVEVKTDYIIALPDTSPPQADFSASPMSGYAPLEAIFNNLSTGLVDSMKWYFGDGDSSAIEHPTHSYSAPDTYTVKLVVYGPYGTDEEIKIDYIKVQEAPQIEAAFSAAPLLGVVPLGVNFTDQSIGIINTWQWSFGDGDSSFVQNPIHIFDTPGTYDVSLRILGPSGEDTEVKYEYISAYLEAPSIDSIVDVPADQGGWVRIYVKRSGYDLEGETEFPISVYYVWRRIDDPLFIYTIDDIGEEIDFISLVQNSQQSVNGTMRENDESDFSVYKRHGRYFLSSQSVISSGSFPPGIWEIVGSMPGMHLEQYIHLTPTIADSLDSQVQYSVYIITAHTVTPSIYFTSPPDSGYSIDNLPPCVPQGFTVAYNTGTGNQLTWDSSPEPDFQYYRIYRGDDENFTPGPGNLVHETATEGWTDPEYDGWDVHYKITALDYVGNESDAASPTSTTGDDVPSVPTAFALYQNAPNPFNPTTAIRFDLPSAVHVKLCVYNVKGELIAALANQHMREGRKEVTWNAKDNRGRAVSSGIYFYRLVGGDFVQTKKMVLLR